MTSTDQQQTLFCPQCDYNLTGLPENRCPECGEAFDPDAIIEALPTPIGMGGVLVRLTWPPVATVIGIVSSVFAVGGLGWGFLVPSVLAFPFAAIEFMCWNSHSLAWRVLKGPRISERRRWYALTAFFAVIQLAPVLFLLWLLFVPHLT